MIQVIIQTKQIGIDLFYNPKLRTHLDGISGKNPLRDRLVRLVYTFTKSITETSSKLQEPKTYNKAINHPIYRNKWHKAINEELSNLDAYQTWYYTTLPYNKKAIGYK